MKILLIEDDNSIAEFVKIGLESESYVVDLARNGRDGSYMARVNNYDAIVLDYSLPEKDGLKVLDEVRQAGFMMPIIFLSATLDVENKIKALEKGADDYMTKPFSFDELKTRIKTLLRRPNKIQNSIIKIKDIVIDIDKQRVFKNDIQIYLTRKEYSLLEFLMRKQGTVVTRGMLMEHVWNADGDPFSNTIESHILNLRKKIGDNKDKDLIRNVPGRGYIIDV